MTSDDLAGVLVGQMLYGLDATTRPGQKQQTWRCGYAGRYLAGSDVGGRIAVSDCGTVRYWSGKFLLASFMEASKATDALNAGQTYADIKPDDFIPPVET